MRNILLVAGVVGIIGAFSACSGSKDKPTALSDDNPAKAGARSTGGRGSATGSSGANVGGAGGEAEVQASNAPVIKITSPAGSATPDDGVLLEQTAHVLCTVIQSTAPDAAEIDPASVSISLLDSARNVIEQKPASATKNDNEYAADFVLTTVPSGAVSFACAASDKNQVKGTDSVATFVDHGPTITVVTPLPNSANALKGGLAVKFSVDPTPLIDNDDGAAVDVVTFSLDGKTYDLKEKSGTYSADIALDALPTVPTGAITITASNSRKPMAATAIKPYNILVDGDGPVISIQSPQPNDVKGGKVTLSFTVTDKGSGVDPHSVNVLRYPGDSQHFYSETDSQWGEVGDQFSYTFDTKDVEVVAKYQTTINVRATDKVGNTSANGQSVAIYLDNVPPQVDVDPINIRTINTAKACSSSFDPVGDKTVNDLEGSFGGATLGRHAWFRAFVWERTNDDGQDIHYYSGTDQTQVRLYVQADPANAKNKLLVNNNPGEDTSCDDIGGIKDVANPPPFSSMVGLAPAGAPWSQKDPAQVPKVSGDAVCTLADAPAPLALCPSHLSDLWYTTQHADGDNEPAVYAVSPNPNNDSCAGVDIEFLSLNQPDGWVCVAARAVDKAGNIGISPPIRLCVDSPDIAGSPDCAIMSTTPPTCTDGCTPPTRGGDFFLKIP